MSNLLQSASILLTPTAYNEGFIHSIKPLQTLGSELVTNGDFATDSAWGKGTGWTISDGAGNGNLASGNLGQTGYTFISGKQYKVTYEVKNYVSGDVKFQLTGDATVNGNTVNSNGIYTQYVTATANHTNFRFNPTSFSGSIDNASVKESISADFSFTRATTATRVNSSGLIESVASGLPRINFLGSSSDAHWLLEPQSTNTATYSNDFTQGDIFEGSGNPTLSDTILTANQGITPDGTNTAFLLKDDNDGGSGQTGLSYFNTFVNANDFNTFSVFVKKSLSNNFIFLSSGGYETAANGISYFNIQDGTLSTTSSNHTASMEDYGNGWYRCSITNKAVTDLQGSFNVRLTTADNTVNITRDGTNGVLLFGVQAEADVSRSFATSYIPTSGATVTRNKDQATNSGNSSLISSTEGVLYSEVARFDKDLDFEAISISDGSLSDVIAFKFRDEANKVIGRVTGDSTVTDIIVTASDATDFTKYAISYSTTNDISKFFIDGVQVGTASLSGVTIAGLDTLQLDKGIGGEEFLGKVKSVAVFKNGLDNDELEALTGEGFSSFAALAAAGGFTII